MKTRKWFHAHSSLGTVLCRAARLARFKPAWADATDRCRRETARRAPRIPVLCLCLIVGALAVPNAHAGTKYSKGTAGTWTAANMWSLTSGGTYDQTWVTGDDAVFSVVNSVVTGTSTTFKSITANQNVTMTAGGTLTPVLIAPVTVASGMTFNFNGQSLGTAAGTGINKKGPGTLAMGGASTYPGGFTLDAGTVTIGGVNALGTGPLVINGGTIRANSTAARDLTGKPTSITVNSDFTLGDSVNNGALTFSAPTALGAATRTITLNSGATFGGVISGSAGVGLTKAGSGTLTLNGANTYTGVTTISAGTLSINTFPDGGAAGSLGMSSAASANLIMTGGTLGYTGASTTTDRGLTLNGNGIITVSAAGANLNLAGVIAGGTFDLTKGSTATLTLSGANTWSGRTFVSGGTLAVTSINSVGGAAGPLGMPTTAANALISIGTGTTTTTLSYIGTGDTSDRVINLPGTSGGATLDQSGTGLLKFTSDLTAGGIGSKTLTLQGSTAATGEIAGAIVNNSTTGTTVATAASTASTSLTLGSVDGLTVGNEISGTGITAGTTIISFVASTKVVTLSAAATVASGAVITSAGLVNLTSLTKAGTGTWTLSGVNFYSGPTTINAGKLQGVVGGSCASSTVILNAVAATASVAITDSAKTWTCAAFTANAAGVIEFNFGAVPPSATAPLVVTGAATFTVNPSVSVLVNSGLDEGTYPLMTWGSTPGAVPTAVTVSSLKEGTAPSLSVSGTTLNLVIGPSIPRVKDNNTLDLNNPNSWVGGMAPTSVDIAKWDSTVGAANTTVLGADTTWLGMQIVNPAGLVTINTGHTLTLGTASIDIDMSAATADLTLNCPLALGGANVWDVTTGRTLTLANVVSGVSPVTKQGAGTAILSGANTYNGATTIKNGSLVLDTGADRLLNTGSVVLGDTATTGKLILGGTMVADQTLASLTATGLGGSVVGGNAANSTLTLNIASANTFSGTLGGAGPNENNLPLTKSGAGTLTLSGNNTYSGGSSLNAGLVSVTSATALGSGAVTFNGGTRLTVATGLDFANPITIGPNTGVAGNGLVQAGATAGTATVSGTININSAPTAGGHFAAPTAGTILHVKGAITALVPVTQRIGTVMFSGGGTGYADLTVGQGTVMVGANDGIATTGEIDDAIRYGAGLRWSFMGSFLIYTLAGGDAGMRHFMAQFGPALKLPWTKLEAPELTDGLIDQVVDGTAVQLGKHSIADLERYRDDCLLAVQAAVRATKLKHGIALDE